MQNWQQDLKDLIHTPPAKDVKGIIQRVMRGRLDDRSTALTCAAFAEIGLVAGLAIVRRVDKDQIIKLFWRMKGEFGTFDKKIKGAFAEELIGPETRDNLNIVREVRNAFAHSMADVRFTTGPIARACDLIVRPAHLPREKVRSRKYRFAYCQVCDQVFRIFLGHTMLDRITPGGRNRKLLLP
jgi:hypothetical protein